MKLEIRLRHEDQCCGCPNYYHPYDNDTAGCRHYKDPICHIGYKIEEFSERPKKCKDDNGL